MTNMKSATQKLEARIEYLEKLVKSSEGRQRHDASAMLEETRHWLDILAELYAEIEKLKTYKLSLRYGEKHIGKFVIEKDNVLKLVGKPKGSGEK